jgi:hypothetical protein
METRSYQVIAPNDGLGMNSGQKIWRITGSSFDGTC